MSEGLFRKATIDKVSSPEQLDLLMRITSPVGWLALLTVGVMIAAVGVWSVLGSIPDLVDAQGTLFRGERIYDLKATMSGNLMTLDVKQGNIVTVGQTIARIKREQVGPEAKAATDMQIMAIEGQMQAKRDEIRTTADQLNANRAAINRNKADIDGLRLQQATDQTALQQKKRLVDQGLSAPKEMTAIEEKMNTTRSRIGGLEADIKQLEANEKSIESRKRGNEAQLGVYEGQIASLRAGGNATSEVKTIEAGRVVEVIKSKGDSVKEGEPLVRIERQTEAAEPSGLNAFCSGDVHALVYIPAGSAGKIQRNQFVRVSPAGVAKEEYGFIFGKVESVATYAASTADMSEKLKNDQLVKQFMAGGPVVEARICLEKDERERKVNPFKWSSSGGPPTDTPAGTPCTVSVVVAEKKPYTYVVPAVRKAIGL